MTDESPKRRETDNSAEGQELEARARALRERLDANASRNPASNEPRTDTASSGIAQAWRLSSEFIAGVLVGAGIGWLIDRLFGTAPWGLIIFLLLGFGAAVFNVMRASGQMAPSRFKISNSDASDTNE